MILTHKNRSALPGTGIPDRAWLQTCKRTFAIGVRGKITHFPSSRKSFAQNQRRFFYDFGNAYAGRVFFWTGLWSQKKTHGNDPCHGFHDRFFDLVHQKRASDWHKPGTRALCREESRNMKYAVIFSIGVAAICGYLLFINSPQYELGELRAENRELRERIISLERSQGMSEMQTAILIAGGVSLGLCFILCYLMYSEISLRKEERRAYLRIAEVEQYKRIFQNQVIKAEIPQIAYQEVA
jgi:hypothetical protein